MNSRLVILTLSEIPFSLRHAYVFIKSLASFGFMNSYFFFV